MERRYKNFVSLQKFYFCYRKKKGFPNKNGIRNKKCKPVVMAFASKNLFFVLKSLACCPFKKCFIQP